MSGYSVGYTEVKVALTEILPTSILQFDFNLSQGSSYYFDNISNQIKPFNRVVAIDDISPYVMPFIDDFYSDSEGDEEAYAGTGDYLIIEGENFGTNEGKVLFYNADTWPPDFEEVNEKDVTWFDDEIEVRLPADQAMVAAGNWFKIRTTNNLEATSEQLDYLNIRYAIRNQRNPQSDEPEIYYLGDALNSTKGDGNDDGILRFTYSVVYNMSTTEEDIIRTAICDWFDETDVHLSLSGTTTSLSTHAPDDDINMILYGTESLYFIGETAGSQGFIIIDAALCDDRRYIEGSTIVIRSSFSNHPNPNYLNAK